MSLSSLEGSLHRGCGGRYARHEEQVTVRLSGMAAEVTRSFFRCEKCGHEQRTIEQRDAAEQAAVERIRERHGLLTPREIRQLREELGLTSPQLADVCYGTPRGIVAGWEKGRYLQNREADALLRSLRDPEVFAFRTARAGVVPAGAVPAGVVTAGAVPAGAATAEVTASTSDAAVGRAPDDASSPTAEGSAEAS
jgi:putative zinc finger/helix-turn-helix YgiT family protein